VLDLLTSKIAMMVAAIIILTTVLGIFTMQREDAKGLELKNIAEKISNSINSINSINGETQESLTFQKEEEGIFLEPEIDGKGYDIILTQNKVLIRQNDHVFIENFVTPIHVWDPEKTAYNSTQILNKDKENTRLEFTSGEDFVILRKMVELDGEKGYMTFVYLL
jgi:hypothetical protein